MYHLVHPLVKIRGGDEEHKVPVGPGCDAALCSNFYLITPPERFHVTFHPNLCSRSTKKIELAADLSDATRNNLTYR